MGWLFTANEDKTLRPASFWGLTRSHLKSKKLSKKIRLPSVSSDEHNQTESDNEDSFSNN